MEFESLRLLILSQQEALAQNIKDLGTINLTLTKAIEKRKRASNSSNNTKKIPRSLRIKCELSTSPDFADDPDFLHMKDELRQVITTCIEKGTNIMTKWAAKNLTLFNSKCCLNYLGDSLQVLEGLTSLYTDIVGTPLWPSVDDKYFTLFMLKIYLSNTYIAIIDITGFLEMPPEQILSIGAKLLLNTTSKADSRKKSLIV